MRNTNYIIVLFSLDWAELVVVKRDGSFRPQHRSARRCAARETAGASHNVTHATAPYRWRSAVCKLFIRADELRESKPVAVDGGCCDRVGGGEESGIDRWINTGSAARPQRKCCLLSNKQQRRRRRLTLLFYFFFLQLFVSGRRLVLTGCVMMTQYRSITETNPETTVRESDDPGWNRFESV